MKAQQSNYREVIKDDESLMLFLSQLAKFDRVFCDFMAEGDDFTMSLEVRGNKGKVMHIRVRDDGFKRPKIGGSASNGNGDGLD